MLVFGAAIGDTDGNKKLEMALHSERLGIHWKYKEIKGSSGRH